MRRWDEIRVRAWTRTALFAIGVLLGASGLFLIVTASSQKDMAVGILLGLWGLFLAAWAGAGAQRPAEPAALVRRREADERGGFEVQLRAVLRQEIRQTVRTELAQLHTELRELVDPVAGKVRLERTETTRLIGADLDALHAEARRLGVGRRLAGGPDASALPGQPAAADAPGPSGGRHAWHPPEAEPSGPAPAAGPGTSPGGRRRREDNERNEVLDRLLGSS